jgi:hypothetical protein
MAASAPSLAASTSASPTTPYEPTRLSFMMARIWSLPHPPPKPSQLSASASSWKAPVSHTVATVEIAAATRGGRPSAARANAAAPNAPTTAPMAGNHTVLRARYSASCPTHAGHGRRVRNMTPVSSTRS